MDCSVGTSRNIKHWPGRAISYIVARGRQAVDLWKVRRCSRSTANSSRGTACRCFLYVELTLSHNWRTCWPPRRTSRYRGPLATWVSLGGLASRARQLLASAEADNKSTPIFASRRGVPLRRVGGAYIIRKSVAATAGRCPSLGHKRVCPHAFTTTHEYAEAGLEMKLKTIAAIAPSGVPSEFDRTLHRHKNVRGVG